MKERLTALEERVAALEGSAQKRQSSWNELVECFEMAIVSFCDEYTLPVPEKIKQKELHF